MSKTPSKGGKSVREQIVTAETGIETRSRLVAITPKQLKAARGLAGWRRKECSDATGLSPESIKNIEHGIFKPQPKNLEKIIRAFSDKGVEFFNLNPFSKYGLNLTGVMLVEPKEQPSRPGDEQ